MSLSSNVQRLAALHAERAALEHSIRVLKSQELELTREILADPAFEPETFRESYTSVTLRETFPPSDPIPWQAVQSLPFSPDDLHELEKSVCLPTTILPDDAYKAVQNMTPGGGINGGTLLQMRILTAQFDRSPRSEIDRILIYPDLQCVLPGRFHRTIHPDPDSVNCAYSFAMRRRP